jgi:hypothetical protein
MAEPREREVRIALGLVTLDGDLALPADPRGLGDLRARKRKQPQEPAQP